MLASFDAYNKITLYPAYNDLCDVIIQLPHQTYLTLFHTLSYSLTGILCFVSIPFTSWNLCIHCFFAWNVLSLALSIAGSSSKVRSQFKYYLLSNVFLDYAYKVAFQFPLACHLLYYIHGTHHNL